MPEYLNAWGLVSTHGNGARRMAQRLREGVSAPTEISQENWPVPANGRSLAFYGERNAERKGALSIRDLLAARLEAAWAEAMEMLSRSEQDALRADCALVFASTKGCVEDFIWNSPTGDPYSPVVEEFLRLVSLRPKHWLTLSNACASSHSALHLGRQWLKRKKAKYVVVLAADFVGPFVLQGFHSLRALSPTTIRPFDRGRDGLLLGEAAGVAILSSNEAELVLSGSEVDCEGYAVTRPESSATSLQSAIRSALRGTQPDAVIAHGTATVANDSAEDRAFSSVLEARPWIVGTKWSVGHCLGASGLVDLIAGAEWLREGRPFSLGNCREPDPAFHSRFLTNSLLADMPPREWKSLLMTALGFGGVHSALLLERA